MIPLVLLLLLLRHRCIELPGSCIVSDERTGEVKFAIIEIVQALDEPTLVAMARQNLRPVCKAGVLSRGLARFIREGMKQENSRSFIEFLVVATRQSFSSECNVTTPRRELAASRKRRESHQLLLLPIGAHFEGWQWGDATLGGSLRLASALTTRDSRARKSFLKLLLIR